MQVLGTVQTLSKDLRNEIVRVQDEKHDTTNINDIHHNKVDTSEAPLPRAWLCRGKLGSSEQTS